MLAHKGGSANQTAALRRAYIDDFRSGTAGAQHLRDAAAFTKSERDLFAATVREFGEMG